MDKENFKKSPSKFDEAGNFNGDMGAENELPEGIKNDLDSALNPFDHLSDEEFSDLAKK